jgi:ppGpp synthetase/RelA/SpoT-type nucleotidyltranferase
MFRVDEQTIAAEFERRWPMLGELEREARFILEPALRAAPFKTQSITSRVKDLPSIIKKTERKELKAPFEELTDLLGLRIICLFLSDVKKVKALLESVFDLVSEDDKIDDAPPNLFGYFAVHHVVTMKADYAGPRYEQIRGIKFEIQVKTIAMDPWASVSHYLQYRSEEDIPRELRRDFNALSGLFYLADRHFELFYSETRKARAELREVLDSSARDDGLSTDITLDSLTAYLDTRFPERLAADAKDVAALASQLRNAGYTSLGTVDAAVNKAVNAFNQYERDQPPGRDGYSRVGAVRVSVEMVNPAFHRLAVTSDDRFREVEGYLRPYRESYGLI